MIKIKRTLIGLLVMVLVIGAGFIPMAEVKANEICSVQVSENSASDMDDAHSDDIYYDYYNGNYYDKDGYDNIGYDKNGYDRNGYDCNGYNKAGYDKDGYNKDGYDNAGYDRNGYNKDGYDKDGYSIYGFDMNGNRKKSTTAEYFIMSNAVINAPCKVFNCSDKFDLKVHGEYGDVIKSSNYKVSIKNISTIGKGYGTYKVTVKCNAKYKNKILTKTITVVPDIRLVMFSVMMSGESKGKLSRTVQLEYPESALKTITGIQYVIGKDKAYKNIYVKATTKFKTPVHGFGFKKKGMWGKTYFITKNEECHIKYRVYVTVGGKNIYSEWIKL